MKKTALFAMLNPYTFVKVIASSIGLVTNAIQLSEVSTAYGEPVEGLETQWHERATLVAFEARQIRGDLGVLSNDE